MWMERGGKRAEVSAGAMIDGVKKVEKLGDGLSQFLLRNLMNPKSMKSNPSEIVLTKFPAPASSFFLLFKFAVCSIVNITEKHSTELTPPGRD
jgi:hypothetical protein